MGKRSGRKSLWQALIESDFAAFDIVVVPFPYADRLAEKRRPALVISGARLAPYGLVWVAMITSAENEHWPTDVMIADLDRAGLPGAFGGASRKDRLHRSRRALNAAPGDSTKQCPRVVRTAAARIFWYVVATAPAAVAYSHFFHLKMKIGTTAASTINMSADG